MTNSHEALRKLHKMVPYLKDNPDELLYGKAGFLYALLWMRKGTEGDKEGLNDLDKTIQKTVDMIIQCGQVYSEKNQCKSPLMYEWHEKQYFGMAHGLAGILMMLLQAGDRYLSKDQIDNLIKPSINFLISTILESGNVPSSQGSPRDR